MSILSDKGQTFLEAWKKHDTAALRISTAADVAMQNNNPYYTPALALKTETDAFVDAQKAFAEEMQISSVYMMRCLLDLRRDGVDHKKAVLLVVQYLERIA